MLPSREKRNHEEREPSSEGRSNPLLAIKSPGRFIDALIENHPQIWRKRPNIVPL